MLFLRQRGGLEQMHFVDRRLGVADANVRKLDNVLISLSFIVGVFRSLSAIVLDCIEGWSLPEIWDPKAPTL